MSDIRQKNNGSRFNFRGSKGRAICLFLFHVSIELRGVVNKYHETGTNQYDIQRKTVFSKRLEAITRRTIMLDIATRQQKAHPTFSFMLQLFNSCREFLVLWNPLSTGLEKPLSVCVSETIPPPAMNVSWLYNCARTLTYKSFQIIPSYGHGEKRARIRKIC